MIGPPPAGVLDGPSKVRQHHRSATPPWPHAKPRCVVCYCASAATFDLPKKLFQDWLLAEAAHDHRHLQKLGPKAA